MKTERKQLIFEVTKNIYRENKDAYRYAKNAITEDGIHTVGIAYDLSTDIPLDALCVALSGAETMGLFLAKLLVDNLNGLDVLNAFCEAEKDEELRNSPDEVSEMAASKAESFTRDRDDFYRYFEEKMETGDNVSGCGYEYFVDVYVEAMKMIHAQDSVLF